MNIFTKRSVIILMVITFIIPQFSLFPNNLKPKKVAAQTNDFYIQRGYTIIQNGQTTATITAGTDYAVPTGQAFIRIINTRLTGTGRTNGGSNQNMKDFSVYISNPENITKSITFTRAGTTNSTRIAWEIIEYKGAAGGVNEIKVKNAGTMSFTNEFQKDTPPVSGITNDNNVVVFITSQNSSYTGKKYWGAALFTSEWLAASDSARFIRDDIGDSSNTNLSYAVVEFSGSNWKIQRVSHTYSTAGNTETETITPVGSLNKVFLHCQLRHGPNLEGIDEQGQECWPSENNKISFMLQNNATVKHTGVAWIVENIQSGSSEMNVQQISGTRNTMGSKEDTWIQAISPVASIANTSIMGESARSSGTGTSYPRGSISLNLISQNSVEMKQSDDGEMQYYRFSIIQWPTSTVSISISMVTDSTVSFGTQALNTTKDTTAAGINDPETIRIDAGPADLYIKSSPFTDGSNTWQLSNINGTDQVLWEYSKDQTSWTAFSSANTLYTLDRNVQQNQTRDIFFRLKMPTSSASYKQYGSTITIVAAGL